MTTQVRIYRITPGELQTFVHEWRELIAPLRERHGFVVEHAWASDEDGMFVWVLRYDGEDWQAADRAYYESDERRTMAPDPARLIETFEAFLARSVALP